VKRDKGCLIQSKRRLMLHFFLSFLVPQGPPVNIQASVISSTSLFLNYSSPLVPYGYITSYSIQVIETNALGSNASILVANSSGSFTVIGLLPFTYYNISVAASTRIGMGPYDAVIIRTFQDSK